MAQSKLAGQRSAEEQRLLDVQKPYNLDAWDGYGHEREALLRHAGSQGSRLVSLAGDSHNAWASNLRRAEGEIVGVELACQSITSPGAEDRLKLPDIDAAVRLEQALIAALPELAYCNLSERGYLSIDFRAESTGRRVGFCKRYQRPEPCRATPARSPLERGRRGRRSAPSR